MVYRPLSENPDRVAELFKAIDDVEIASAEAVDADTSPIGKSYGTLLNDLIKPVYGKAFEDLRSESLVDHYPELLGTDTQKPAEAALVQIFNNIHIATYSLIELEDRSPRFSVQPFDMQFLTADRFKRMRLRLSEINIGTITFYGKTTSR